MLQSPYTLRSSHLSSQIFYVPEHRYQLKTAIHVTSVQLNTADGSPMTALGITTLQLRMVDFKFLHKFIICDRLPNMELLFGIDEQKKLSLSYAWDR